MRKEDGFTLLELMIVVAIIGILGAIAIPSFIEMQMRTKRSEMPVIITGIRESQMAYQYEFDVHMDCLPNPPAPSPSPQPWVQGMPDWEELGYQPDGLIRASYETEDLGNDFIARGKQDLDMDGTISIYEARRSLGAERQTPMNIY